MTGADASLVLRGATERIVRGESLSRDECRAAFGEIMDGLATDAQIAAFLTALRMRGETAAEIAGIASALRERVRSVVPPSDDLLDTCGTGGDSLGLFNVSTAVALVAAGAGARVAKHGNRSFTSRSGSADALRALGVGVDLPPERVGAVLESAGIAFFFAPLFHAALRHAAAARRDLGFRTVMNLVGPLANPAGARRQLVGVYSPALVPLVAETLASLGALRVLVVSGEEGLDEISIAGPTVVAEVDSGRVLGVRRVAPEDFGLDRSPLDALRVDSPEASASAIRGVLEGEAGPARDIVVLNAAAALVAAGRAPSIEGAIEPAARSIDSGAALAALARLVAATAATG